MPTKSEENKLVIQRLDDALRKGEIVPAIGVPLLIIAAVVVATGIVRSVRWRRQYGLRESTSPGADVRASTTAREKAVTTRLILCTLSGLISGFAAICATIIYSTVLQWRYFWLAVCVAGFVGLCVFLWQACERFYGTEEGSGPV
jgi:magnesium-transporting ATPase (P-type)